MLVVAVFVVGYFAIVFEHTLKVNKAAAALLTGVLCWTVHITQGNADHISEELLRHLGELSQILFFLLAAMTIVELIDAHEGFDVVTSRVTTTNRRRLLFTIAVLTFFLSALLDNLTTAIVMMTLVRKLAVDTEDRVCYGGVVVIAANAGGAWSPIGDVTTTMLWVGHQISTLQVVKGVFVPAIVSAAVPTLWIALRMKGDVRRPGRGAGAAAGVRAKAPSLAEVAVPGPEGLTSINLIAEAAAVGKTLADLHLRARTGASVVTVTRAGVAAAPSPLEPLRAYDLLALAGPADAVTRAFDLLVNGRAPSAITPLERRLVLSVGVGVLLFVPAFKAITHLPPMMGILLGLGVLWMVTELIHKKKNDDGRAPLSVAGALQRIDSQSVLFFLGILLAISALQSNGSLRALAAWLDHAIGNVNLITLAIGAASSIVDNVPLVAAAQGMYSLETFPRDHGFWLFLAYCAGTGGSILIIGSAAGIAVMGIQRITFGAYMWRFSLPAVLGYAAGALTYLGIGALGL